MNFMEELFPPLIYQPLISNQLQVFQALASITLDVEIQLSWDSKETWQLSKEQNTLSQPVQEWLLQFQSSLFSNKEIIFFALMMFTVEPKDISEKSWSHKLELS